MVELDQTICISLSFFSLCDTLSVGSVPDNVNLFNLFQQTLCLRNSNKRHNHILIELLFFNCFAFFMGLK